ncbi:hypothetical protein D3C81_1356510 [compost metagenome]
MQAEVAQLHATRFRHAGPTRYGNAVPGAQTPFQTRRLGLAQAHLLIVFGFDLAGSQGDHPGFVGLAVQAISCQFGIIGMRRNHHHPAALQLDAGGYPQARFALQPTMAATHTQRTGLERCGHAGQVEEAKPIDTALESLPITEFTCQQFYPRVKESPQPTALYPQLQDEGFVTLECRVGLQQPTLQAGRHCMGLITEVVGVVLTRRVEQVVSEPGLMGGPGQRQQQKR